ncbi:MAG: 5'-nucleotidase YjjG [uncultured Nocardioidaceae bacterium]|uniref:5'-nucleotidase YjjG n=1 Tax=uncultured Nocardioidaceae bacterium TaxID=253824 RepID=A0A6J4LCD5_9ACTN|nr:MAG: 5'-nucleotidase YjjG [uncultured Nocardioidaceae bacterium]
MSDLDDTLVERPPLFRSWAEGFLSEQDADPALLDWVVELDRGGHRPREEFLSTLAERVGYEVAVEEFLLDYNRTLAGSYRLVPDARAVLEEARERGWRLAVVTNGLTDVQSLKLSVSGIADLADAVCISEEVGVSKPDPLIFRTAAERADTTLQGAWMLGDNLDADIAGAAGVGARTVWVKRDYDVLDYRSGVEPDFVASTFPEAVRVVLDES